MYTEKKGVTVEISRLLKLKSPKYRNFAKKEIRRRLRRAAKKETFNYEME